MVDATNKDELLALGRRIFSAASTETEQRPSINLLKEKEAELRRPTPKIEPKVKTATTRVSYSKNENPLQNLSQEQITEEIKELKEKNETLANHKKDLQQQIIDMQQNYNDLIIDSVKMKKEMKNEILALKKELQETLVPPRPVVAHAQAPSILPVMKELSDLNDQILAKISSFRQATRDALAHCERAALDKYKPYMDKLLKNIYKNAENLPIDQLIERFNDAAEKVEEENKKIQDELTTEHSKNENLQLEARQLEERLNAQQDEVNRMRKQQTQLVRDIAKLNQISAQTMNSLKGEYQRLLTTDEPGDIVPTSARAVVVTPKVNNSKKKTTGRASALKKDFSRKKIITVHETKTPAIPSVEEFIDMVKNELEQQIQQGTF